MKCAVFSSQARDDIHCSWEGPLSSSALILSSFYSSPPATRSIISSETSILVMMEASLSFLWLERCWPRFPGPILTQVTKLCLPRPAYTSQRLHRINEMPKLYLNANAKLIVSPSIGILPLFLSIFLMINLCSWSDWQCDQSNLGIKIMKTLNHIFI